MSIDLILPIILILGLVVTFVYLHIKKIKNDNVSLVIEVRDIIDYTPKQSVLSLFEMLLLSEINSHRRQLGAPKLSPERECRAQAYTHTKHMINNNKPSHDNTYKRKFELLRRGFTLYGENVAHGFSTAKSFFIGYMNSESHKKIIEDSRYTHIGVRVLIDENGKYYNTLIFTRYEE